MDSSIYEDAMTTPAFKLYRLLRDNLQPHFRAFYYGDPVLIPESLMPCIVVDTVDSTSELGPTGFDELTQNVMVKVIFNKKDDFNAKPDQFLTKQKVEFFAEGRDKTTGEYLNISAQGILRRNVTVEATSSDNMFNLSSKVNYDVIIRPEETMTQEAHITLTVNGIIRVSNRN